MSKSSHLKIGLFNAGSLNTGHEEFTVAMEELGPDIMAINETWLRAGEDDKAPKLSGYHFRHTPRSVSVHGGRGGGTGFYIRKGITVRLCPHPHTSSVEQMWLRVRVSGLDVIVGTAYRPPWQDINLFLDTITESIVSLSRCDKLVFLGDLNIDLLSPNSNKAKLFLEFLDSLSLKQIVADPTHFTDDSQSLIDVICTDARVRSVTVKHTPDLGGHAMLLAEFNIKKDKVSPRLITYRPIKSILFDLFSRDVNNVPWQYFSDETDVNKLVDFFTSSVLMLFDLHAPLKTVKFKDPPHPWITDTIKDMIKTRDGYHRLYKSLTKDKSTKASSMKECYKQMKKFVIAAVQSDKKAYFSQNINDNIKNPKKLWKNLKGTILPDKSKSDELPQQFNNPDLINSHFLTVPGVSNVAISHLTYFEYHRFSRETFSLQTISSDTVMTIMRGLKSNAQGIDGISLAMLQLTMPQSIDAITAIVNRSIASGVFPESWKVAVVKPLPKTSIPTSAQDLRPISILPCISKVLERAVCMQVTKYLENNRILPPQQSGFRKKHSTATALLDVVDNLLDAQDKGLVSILVLLDFSRAFDSINVSLLLSKLIYYGFEPTTVKWFHSYLENRQQLVELSKSDGSRMRSALQPVPRGVPQGSILGPILFILYSADIVTGISHCKHHLYADDLQLYLSFPPSALVESVSRINCDLEKICQWSKNNSLLINPKKSKFMLIGSRSNIQRTMSQVTDIKICVDGVAVEQVSEARNLGLCMDSNLRFEKHVSECVRNCFYRLKLLYKIRPYLSVDVRVMLCESLVLSRLNYSDVVYGPCLLGRTLKLIQRVQNACGRFCFHIPPRSHVTPYLNSSNLLKMAARRKLHLSVLLFGVINSQTPRYLYDKFVWAQAQSRYPSRACTYVFVTPGHKTMAFRGSFKYSASRCWNDLPPPIRALKTVNTFRMHVKRRLLSFQKEGISA